LHKKEKLVFASCTKIGEKGPAFSQLE